MQDDDRSLQRISNERTPSFSALPEVTHALSFLALSSLFSTGLGVATSTLFFAQGSLATAIIVACTTFVISLLALGIRYRRQATKIEGVMAGYRPDTPLLAEKEAPPEPKQKQRWRHPSIQRAIDRRREKKERRKNEMMRLAHKNSAVNTARLFRLGSAALSAPLGVTLALVGGLYLAAAKPAAAATATALGALVSLLMGIGLLVFFVIAVLDSRRTRKLRAESLLEFEADVD